MALKILIVDDHIDDDEYPIYELPGILQDAGYEVITTSDGENAYDLVWECNPDLIILDIIFGSLGPYGIEITKSIRLNDWTIPIILVTNEAKETEDVLRGFEAGADDYVTYPCDNRVILARIRANLPFDVVRIDDYIEIDFINRIVRIKKDGEWTSVHFPPLEFDLLKILVINAGTVVLSLTLKERVWGKLVSDSALQTAISRIRKKIEPDPKHPTYIITVQEIGYRFEGKPYSVGSASIGGQTRYCRE